MLIGTMHQLDPTGAPQGRGIPLVERDPNVRYWLQRFDGDPSVTTEWERALAAPPGVVSPSGITAISMSATGSSAVAALAA